MWWEKHTTEFLVRTTWARRGSLTYDFAKIAKESYTSFLTERNQYLSEPEGEDGWGEYISQQETLREHSIKTVVFSAMTMEAAIYELAAIHLTDKYVSDNLDKLGLIAKWIVFPKLICGNSLKENGPAINSLRTLVWARDKLIHYKSYSIAPSERTENISRKLESSPDEAFKCIVLTSLEINHVLRTPSGVLPAFEKEVITTEITPDILKPIIDNCREIHVRNNA